MFFWRTHRSRFQLLKPRGWRNSHGKFPTDPQYRRLSMQSLEARRMLASINTEFKLFEDINGVPGAEITNDTVVSGQDIFVQLLFQHVSMSGEADPPGGVLTYQLNLNYGDALDNTDPIDPQDNAFDVIAAPRIIPTGWSLLPTPNPVDNNVGMISGLAAFSFNSNNAIGINGPDPASVLKFRAQGPVIDAPLTVTGAGGVLVVPGNSQSIEVVTVSSIEAHTVTVLNGNTAEVSVAAIPTNEGNSGSKDMTFNVTMTEIVDVPVTVSFNTMDGTALAANGTGDYQTTTGTVSLNPGETMASFTVPINGDMTVEQNEEFTVQISNLVANGSTFPVVIDATQSTATGTIFNDDSAQVVITSNPDTEGNGGTKTRTYMATLSQPADVDVKFGFATADGTARTIDNDYLATNGQVTFLAGTNTPQMFTVDIESDTKVELDEDFTVQLLNFMAQDRDVTLNQLVVLSTIQNDDMAEISIGNVAPTLEGDSPTTTDYMFEVTISNQVDTDVTVDFTTMDGDATDENGDNDYQFKNGKVTFLAGTTTTQTILVTVIGDNAPEVDEVFSVVLGNLMAGGRNVALIQNTGTGTILNEDAGVFVTDAVWQEGNSGQTMSIFKVMATPAQPMEFRVTFNTMDGTATVIDGDYVAVVDRELVFTPNLSEIEVPVAVLGDNIVEDDELFSAMISQSTGPEIVGAIGSGMIENDDAAVISIGNRTATEDDGGNMDAEFTVSLSNPIDVNTRVNFATSDNSAEDENGDGDYVGKIGMVEFAALNNSDQIIAITINPDLIVEMDETFDVLLSNLTLPQVRDVTIVNSVGRGTILNDDSAIVSIGDFSSAEGDSGPTNNSFAVSLSQQVDVPIQYDFTTANGTALNGTSEEDYQSIGGTNTFAAFNNSNQTVDVSVNGDTKVELDEFYNVVLSNLTALGRDVTLGNVTGKGTIDNDDSAVVTIRDAIVTEGDTGTTAANFLIELSNMVDAPVTATFVTANGSAQDENGDGDYVSNTDMATIPTGSMSGSIAITVQGDNKFESNENYNATLSNLMAGSPARDVTIQDGTGQGTILNDDDIPEITIDSMMVQEPDQGQIPVILTVMLSNPSANDVSVDFATVNVEAQDENGTEDYQRNSGRLTFVGDPVGETQKTITVMVNADSDDTEMEERLRVVLSNAQGGVINQGAEDGEVKILGVQMEGELSGFVYLDNGNAGTRDPGDLGLAGVPLSLFTASQVDAIQTVHTDATGRYTFTGLSNTETYEIRQADLSSILNDGSESIGTQGGKVADDHLFDIVITEGNGEENNFGEGAPVAGTFSKRDFLSSSKPFIEVINNAIANIFGNNNDNVAQSNISSDSVTVVDEEEFTATPQVILDEDQAIVIGTNGDDHCEFVAGENTHTVIINDEVHTLPAAQITSVRFVGGGGQDTADIVGSRADETAELTPGSATFRDQGLSYVVVVTDVERISIDGGAGNNEAVLIDSPANDALDIEISSALLMTELFMNQVVNFDLVRAVSNAGGIDVVNNAAAADFVLQLQGNWRDEAFAAP